MRYTCHLFIYFYLPDAMFCSSHGERGAESGVCLSLPFQEARVLDPVAHGQCSLASHISLGGGLPLDTLHISRTGGSPHSPGARGAGTQQPSSSLGKAASRAGRAAGGEGTVKPRPRPVPSPQILDPETSATNPGVPPTPCVVNGSQDRGHGPPMAP